MNYVSRAVSVAIAVYLKKKKTLKIVFYCVINFRQFYSHSVGGVFIIFRTLYIHSSYFFRENIFTKIFVKLISPKK